MEESNIPIIKKKSNITLIVIRSLIFCFVVMVIVAIWLPNFDVNCRQVLNQMGAATTLRDFQIVLDEYKEKCGGFPESLDRLQEPYNSNKMTCQHSGLLEKALGKVELTGRIEQNWLFDSYKKDMLNDKDIHVHNGYSFQFIAKNPIRSKDRPYSLFEHYEFTAKPIIPDITGFDSFFMTDDGNIHHARKNDAGPNDEIQNQPYSHIKTSSN